MNNEASLVEKVCESGAVAAVNSSERLTGGRHISWKAERRTGREGKSKLRGQRTGLTA